MTTTKTRMNGDSAVREAPAHPPEIAEHVDELPHEVVVPDDLSGLEVAEPTRSTRQAQAVRWLPWIAAFALLAMGVGIALAALLDSDGTQTLASDRTTAQVMIQESIDAARAEQNVSLASDRTTAQVMIQESIDAALAEQNASLASDRTTAQVMIQESIDAARAERGR